MALNRPLKDLWNKDEVFTHMPFDAFFFDLEAVEEVNILQSHTQETDSKQCSKILNLGYDCLETGILYKVTRRSDNSVYYRLVDE